MGCGWYRTAYYPPEALIDRRSTDDLADELVREIETGVGETGVRPGIIGEIGTDKPWVSPTEERVHRAAARAARRTGLAITTHAVLSDVGLAQLRIFEEEGLDPARVVIGHADSYPVLEHYLAIIERGANLEFDFLGMPWERERIGEDRTRRAAVRAAGARPCRSDPAEPGRLQRFAARALRRQRVRLPGRRPSCHVCARPASSDAEIETMTVDEPAAAPDDRVDLEPSAGYRVSPRASPRRSARRCRRARLLIGQPSFVASAAAVEVSGGHARDARHGRSARSRRPATRRRACRT